MAKNKSNHLGSLFNREALYDHDSSYFQDSDHDSQENENLLPGMQDSDFKVRKIHHRKYKKQSKRKDLPTNDVIS